jgi:hypothetical protein
MKRISFFLCKQVFVKPLLFFAAILFRSLNILISPDWFRKTIFAKKDHNVSIGKGFIEAVRNTAGA